MWRSMGRVAVRSPALLVWDAVLVLTGLEVHAWRRPGLGSQRRRSRVGDAGPAKPRPRAGSAAAGMAENGQLDAGHNSGGHDQAPS